MGDVYKNLTNFAPTNFLYFFVSFAGMGLSWCWAYAFLLAKKCAHLPHFS